MRDAPHRKSDRSYLPAVKRHGSRDGDNGELVGLTIAYFEVMRCSALGAGRDVDRHDKLAATKRRVLLRCVVRQAVEVSKRDCVFAPEPAHAHRRVERSECNREVRWIDCNTGIGPTEDRMIAIETVQRRAT